MHRLWTAVAGLGFIVIRIERFWLKPLSHQLPCAHLASGSGAECRPRLSCGDVGGNNWRRRCGQNGAHRWWIRSRGISRKCIDKRGNGDVGRYKSPAKAAWRRRWKQQPARSRVEPSCKNITRARMGATHPQNDGHTPSRNSLVPELNLDHSMWRDSSVDGGSGTGVGIAGVELPPGTASRTAIARSSHGRTADGRGQTGGRHYG